MQLHVAMFHHAAMLAQVWKKELLCVAAGVRL